MSEKAMRHRVVKALRPLDAISVENVIYPGTPDVNCVGGWIELKQVARWPRFLRALLQIRHFTQEQRIWLRRRWWAGGGAFLLLQVGREWLLFDGETAFEVGRSMTEEAMREGAIRVWSDGLVDEELIECIMKTRRARGRRISTRP